MAFNLGYLIGGMADGFNTGLDMVKKRNDIANQVKDADMGKTTRGAIEAGGMDMGGDTPIPVVYDLPPGAAPPEAGGGGGGGSGGGGGGGGGGEGGDPRNKEQMIRYWASYYGHDPDTAVKVARSEGLGIPIGDKGTSFGSFQLHTPGGLGDDYRKDTGKDPSNLANEDDTIRWAMANLGRTGWEPYHGAARVGIGPRFGIGTGPLTKSAAPLAAPAAAPSALGPTNDPTLGVPDRLAAPSDPTLGVPSGPAQSTSALGAPTRLAVGDSLAGGFVDYAKVPGKYTMSRKDPNYASADAAAGRSPQEVLDYVSGALKSDPNYFQGKDIILSSGVSNNPAQHNLVPKILSTVKGGRPHAVTLVGVGDKAGTEGGRSYDLRPYNPMLQGYANDAGVQFGGPVPAVVHPSGSWYQSALGG